MFNEKLIPFGLQPYLRFEGGTGEGLEGPVIPSEEVLGALGHVGHIKSNPCWERLHLKPGANELRGVPTPCWS